MKVNSVVYVAAISLVLAGKALGGGALIILQPVPPKTQPPSRYPPGSSIVGRELLLSAVPQRVWFEVHATGWAPQNLKTIQVKIDSNGFATGTGSDLVHAIDSCAVNADCRAQISGIPSPCASGEPSRCVPRQLWMPPGGPYCEPGFQNYCETDWILGNAAGVPAFDLSTPNFRYGCFAQPPEVLTDFGPSYLGTLVVDVPAGASGTYTMGFDEIETFMKDDSLPIS